MIKFTQYLRPDGRRKLVYIKRSPAVEAQALALEQARVRFEAEVLSTGVVSLTAELDPPASPSCRGREPQPEAAVVWQTTLAIELVPNGPEIPAAVDRLMEAATKSLALRV